MKNVYKNIYIYKMQKEIDIQIPVEECTVESLNEYSKRFCEDLDIEPYNLPGVYNIYDLIKTCSSKTCYDPQWGILAGRMLNNEINRTCGKTFSESTRLLKSQLNKEYYDFVQANAHLLDPIENPQNSRNRQSIAVFTCLKSYLRRYSKCGGCKQCNDCEILWVGENIEQMYLRVATFLAMPDIDRIYNIYNSLSLGYHSCATPTLYNAGAIRHQMASCFVGTVADNLHTIEDYWVAFGEISRNAGGIGCDFSRIRHSLIGNVGKSDGVAALLPTYQSILRYVDQSKKRKGSAAVFLAIWHIDIESIIKMKDPKGADSNNIKCLDLNYCVWANDVFFKRVQDNAKWSLFCPAQCPGLSETYGDEFAQLYCKYESEGKYIKQVDARHLLFEIINVQIATGEPYLSNADTINRCNMQSNIGPIRSSNLCVSGDTKVLTDNGYYRIKSLVDKDVNVWNGEEFSNTTVRQTGTDVEMMCVKFSNGTTLKCTPDHKFYIQTRVPRHSPKQMHLNTNYVHIIPAKELKVGHKLIKCEYPVLDNGKKFPYAYTHGAFCGDGTYENPSDEVVKCGKRVKYSETDWFCNRHTEHYDYYKHDPSDSCQAILYNVPRISLYGVKQELISHLEYRYCRTVNEKQDRIDCMLHLDLLDKYIVPINYRLKDKLRWFAGLCDTDGVVCTNGTNKSLQVGSVNEKFINDVKLMLQTMGCDPKINLSTKAGKYYLPNNQGDGKNSLYDCKNYYRLVLTSCDLYTLTNLGFCTYRLKLDNVKPQRNAKRFITVMSVEHLSDRMDTYCFTEPKRGMGIFNGVITGQCQEITLHTSDTEIASCNLASLCLPKFVHNREFDYTKFVSTIRLVVRMLDNVVSRNYYPDRELEIRQRNRERIYAILDNYCGPVDDKIVDEIMEKMESKEILQNIKNANLRNRPLGIGVQGLGDAIAKMDLCFDSPEAMELNNKISQYLYYYAVDESANIARELGNYPRFAGSPYESGILHPDKWVSPSGKTAVFLEELDWDALREKVKGGMRNSTLIAYMPTASTSIIAGNSPAAEPINCIIGTKTILSGQHVVLSNETYNDFKKLGVWTPRLVKEIMDEHAEKEEDGVVGVGGIQHLSMPPEIADNPLKRARFNYLLQKYRTAYELSTKCILNQAIARTPFTCQSQSMNLFINNPSIKQLMQIYNYGWQEGLKTLVYYVRGTVGTKARNISGGCKGDSCSG